MNKKEQLKYIHKAKSRQKKLKEMCTELWQEIVKARANYKCEYPGCRRSADHYKIDAHHFYTKGGYPHLRYDLDNGIALCYQHHTGSREGAHSDPLFKDKILGKIEGYKAVRDEEWLRKLEWKANYPYKLSLEEELLYLKAEAKKIINKLPRRLVYKYELQN